MIIFFAFALLTVYGWPVTPGRDLVAIDIFDKLTPLVVTATLILLFFVFDATLSLSIFVSQLSSQRTVWPNDTRELYAGRTGLATKDEIIDYWIDIDFIAKRSACIGDLIYYPFIILALLILSRSTIFAAFIPNIPIIFTLSLSFSILWGCAFLLRKAAEDAREAAKKKIREEILQLKHADLVLVPAFRSIRPSEPTLETRCSRLEALLKRVENVQEGAFRPIPQQPPVRAVLLPVASVGFTLLTELGWLAAGH